MSRVNTIYDDRYRSIISLLVSIRAEHKISQLDLAKHLNMRQSDISKIETFVRRADLLEIFDYLQAISDLSEIEDSSFTITTWNRIYEAIKK